jgi:hypothetical protein
LRSPGLASQEFQDYSLGKTRYAYQILPFKSSHLSRWHTIPLTAPKKWTQYSSVDQALRSESAQATPFFSRTHSLRLWFLLGSGWKFSGPGSTIHGQNLRRQCLSCLRRPPLMFISGLDYSVGEVLLPPVL